MPDMTMPLPDDARLAIRSATWPNRDAEAEAIHRADQAVFDKVREHEKWLVGRAEGVEEKLGEALNFAERAFNASADLAETVRRGKAEVTPAIASEYKQRRAALEKSIDDLCVLRGDIEFQADRCAKPYESMTNVLNKFSILRVGRTWTTR